MAAERIGNAWAAVWEDGVWADGVWAPVNGGSPPYVPGDPITADDRRRRRAVRVRVRRRGG
jgi:hypothetical protein